MPVVIPSRCLGRFKISKDVLVASLGAVETIMVKLRAVVVHAEMRYETNTIDYVAISPLFAEVAEGTIAPEYDIKLTHGELLITNRATGEEIGV